MSRTLYLLRHGQTRYNAEQRLQGRCNSDLTARGEAQASAMGARLREQIAEPAHWRVYASPLGRARQTALLVCEQLGIESEQIIWDERLVELGMGEWEGCRVPDLLEDHPERDIGQPDWYLQAPGCEGVLSIQRRAQTWPSSFPTACLAPCCAAPMPISTMPPPGARSCHRMPSSSSAVAGSSGFNARSAHHHP